MRSLGLTAEKEKKTLEDLYKWQSKGTTSELCLLSVSLSLERMKKTNSSMNNYMNERRKKSERKKKRTSEGINFFAMLGPLIKADLQEGCANYNTAG